MKRKMLPFDERTFRRDFSYIVKDYEYKADIMSPDNPTLGRIKLAMTHLTQAERNLLITYCEAGSYRRVAKVFHCSHQRVKLSIDAIRDKIRNELERNH